MEESQNQHNNTGKPAGGGYREKDINLKGVFLVAGGVLVILVLIVVFLDQFFILSKEEVVYQQVLAPQSKALRELRAHEDEVLGSYGVIDKDKGVYRIPISQAMKVVADESFKERQKEKK